MPIQPETIQAEAERRHRYVCDRPKLSLLPRLRSAHDFLCANCDGRVSVSDLEVTLYESIKEEPHEIHGVEEWLEGRAPNPFGQCSCSKCTTNTWSGIEAAVVVTVDHVEITAKDPDRWVFDLDAKLKAKTNRT